MEDVLDVYQRPYDPKRPQVCMDEISKQLLRETRAPSRLAPVSRSASIMNTSAAAAPTCFCSVSRCAASAGWT